MTDERNEDILSAYPELINVTFYNDPNTNQYGFSKKGRIFLNIAKWNNLSGGVAHEIERIVQGIEGYSRGYCLEGIKKRVGDFRRAAEIVENDIEGNNQGDIRQFVNDIDAPPTRTYWRAVLCSIS